MKVIKLDNRYRAFKKHGFTHALMFSNYMVEYQLIGKIEQFLHSKGLRHFVEFHGRFGREKLVAGSYHKKYYIELKEESYISWLVLNGVLDDHNS